MDFIYVKPSTFFASPLRRKRCSYSDVDREKGRKVSCIVTAAATPHGVAASCQGGGGGDEAGGLVLRPPRGEAAPATCGPAGRARDARGRCAAPGGPGLGGPSRGACGRRVAPGPRGVGRLWGSPDGPTARRAGSCSTSSRSDVSRGRGRWLGARPVPALRLAAAHVWGPRGCPARGSRWGARWGEGQVLDCAAARGSQFRSPGGYCKRRAAASRKAALLGSSQPPVGVDVLPKSRGADISAAQGKPEKRGSSGAGVRTREPPGTVHPSLGGDGAGGTEPARQRRRRARSSPRSPCAQAASVWSARAHGVCRSDRGPSDSSAAPERIESGYEPGCTGGRSGRLAPLGGKWRLAFQRCGGDTAQCDPVTGAEGRCGASGWL